MQKTTGTIKERKRRLTAPEVMAMQKLCHERIITELHAEKAYPGMPLPGVRILSEQYGIPLSVVRTTLDELKTEGILEAVPREGMKVISVPHLPATLKGKRFAVIAFLEESNPRHILNPPIRIANSIEQTINEQGGRLDFINFRRYNSYQKVLELIDSNGVDAILYAEHIPGDSDFLDKIRSRRIPIVALSPISAEIDCVDFDNKNIGQLQANHLLELGHRKTAIFYFPAKNWSKERTEAAQTEFRNRGLAPDLYEFFFERDDSNDSVLHILPEIVKKYTAVIATNDIMAQRILEAAERLGITIPEDFSLIGADNLEYSVLHNLSTVQLSHIELGKAAFELLKRRILAPGINPEPEIRKVKCSIFSRNTTRINFKKDTEKETHS